MLNYYGWFELRESCGEDAWDYTLRNSVHDDIKVELDRFISLGGNEAVLRAVNGTWILLITGSRNHRDPSLNGTLDVLKYVGKKLPGSFGLLHVLDDEETRRDYQGRFGIWRLARGNLIEMVDHLLSPVIPEIEDEMNNPS